MKNIIGLLILLFGINALALDTKIKETPLFDFDVSGSSGNYNGQTYSEIHVGVNLNFTDWLIWRNAAFKRFGTTANEITGLDSSVRFIYNTPFDNGGFKVFAGPGYRWAQPSDKNALMGEAGASLQIGRFVIGVGSKYLKYDKVQLDPASGLETKRDDVSYFITVSGGGGFSLGSSL